MSQRTIVITGSLRGLGYQLSKILIKENKFRVILTSRDASSAQKVVDELKALNTSCNVDYHQLQIDSQQSIEEFVNWLKQTYGTIDVLVNNAAIIDRQTAHMTPKEAAFLILNTNVSSTINMCNAVLPILSKDGKIVIVSSDLGVLKNQGESIKKELSNPDITIQFINDKIQELIKMRADGKVEGWSDLHTGQIVYVASKCLLNSYSRFILAKQLSADQTLIVVNPGWYIYKLDQIRCKTDMGGPAATYTPEQGTTSMLKAINDIPFGQSKTYSGIFLDEKGDPWDY